MLKKLMRFHSDDLWLYTGVEGGLFLLLEVIICCVMYFERPGDSVSVGWTMFPIAASFISLIAVSGHAAVTFDLALRFGQTRRRAMGLFLGLAFFETAFGFALAAGLAALEHSVCPFLWTKLAGMDGWVLGKTSVMIPDPAPGMEVEPGRFFVNTAGELARLPENTLLVNDFSLDWYWWLLIFAAALAGGIIIGSVLQRFGHKGLWVIWCCIMIPFFVIQILPGDIFLFPGQLSPIFLPLLAGLLVAGLLLWSLWSLLHAVVRT